jgi:hypothetical protein
MTLSETQSLVLSKASQHPERLAAAPPGLPAAARDAVFRAMLRNGLLAEFAAPGGHADLAWRADTDGTRVALRATAAGLRAIGFEPEGDEAGTGVGAEGPAGAGRDGPEQDPPVPTADPAQEPSRTPQQATSPGAGASTARSSLRDAANRVLVAWADDAAMRHDLPDAIEALRAVLAKPRGVLATPRRPRQGTKREQVLGLLRRPEGATVGQVVEATSWAPHTVRGFFAGLRKREGIAVAVLERVRQVGPDKQGAKGSYAVYRVGAAG